MGATKSQPQYTKLPATTATQNTYLDNALQQATQNQGTASDYYKSFGSKEGQQPIIDQANQNFQQTTLPQIMNAFGTGSKSSSALNQALAGGASSLNTDIASILANAKLQAATGLAGVGGQQAQVGAGTSQFGYQQNQPQQVPFWKQALLGAIGAGGQVGGSYLGR